MERATEVETEFRSANHEPQSQRTSERVQHEWEYDGTATAVCDVDFLWGGGKNIYLSNMFFMWDDMGSAIGWNIVFGIRIDAYMILKYVIECVISVDKYIH